MAEFQLNSLNIKPVSAVYSWGDERVDYADSVFFGEAVVGGTRSFGRRWTDVAIAANDLEAIFAANYNGDSTKAFEALANYMNTEFKNVIDHHDFGGISANEKSHRPGVLTWGEITDSGALSGSQTMEIQQ